MEKRELSKKGRKRSRLRTVFWTVGLMLSIFLLVIGVWSDLAYHWTAYSNFTRPLTPDELIARQKTIWDWMDLLLIPLILAGGGIWFSWSERRNDQTIAERRVIEERKIAENNAQETALQAYLEQMSELLIDKKLRKSSNEDEVRAVARAWTLTVLRRIKGVRKGAVVRFLYESDLIMQNNNVISLGGANLEGAFLQGATLVIDFLGKANLDGAKYNDLTKWPKGFEPKGSGAILLKQE